MATTQTEGPEIAEWRGVIEDLFHQIEDWIQDKETWPLGKDLAPTVQRLPWTIEVDGVEPYQVPQLLLSKNGRTMWVRPIARRVVGADGRVDLLGTDGPFTLLYSKKRGKWFWVDDKMLGKLRPFTGRLFRRMAELCLR